MIVYILSGFIFIFLLICIDQIITLYQLKNEYQLIKERVVLLKQQQRTDVFILDYLSEKGFTKSFIIELITEENQKIKT